MWVHVRATAVFGISFAVLAIWLARRRSRHLGFGRPGPRRARCCRWSVGEIQYRIDMLWWIVLDPRHARGDALGRRSSRSSPSLWRRRVGWLDEDRTSCASSAAGAPAPGSDRAPSAAGTTAATEPRSPAASSPRAWSAERFADIDPERFFDFGSTRPQVSLVEGGRAPHRLARERVLHRALLEAHRDVVLLLGSEPSLRWRTFCSLVTEPRPRPRRRARGHARLAARRRDAHAARAGHRERERSRPGRAARRPAVPLRGPDRHRRRAARRLPRGRHPVGVALGGRAALRLDDAVAAGRKGALRPACRPDRRPDRHERARQARATSTSSR